MRHPIGTRVKINHLAERYERQKGTIVDRDVSNPDYYLIWLDAEGEPQTFEETEFDVFVDPEIIRITTPDHLTGFRLACGISKDWRDGTANVDVSVRGRVLTNNGFWGTEEAMGSPGENLHLVFTRDGDEIAVANLVDVCAWATGYKG